MSYNFLGIHCTTLDSVLTALRLYMPCMWLRSCMGDLVKIMLCLEFTGWGLAIYANDFSGVL